MSPWVGKFAHVNLAFALLVEGARADGKESPEALHVDTMAEQVPLCPATLGIGA